MSYAESKKRLDTIRQAYGCKGDVLFRTSIMYVIEQGAENYRDHDFVESVLRGIDQKHDEAESNGRTLIITREFDKALILCAEQIAKEDTINIILYLQREIWYSATVNEISYDRAIQLLKGALSYCDWDHEENAAKLKAMQFCGFYNEEIELLGYGFVLGEENE